MSEQKISVSRVTGITRMVFSGKSEDIADFLRIVSDIESHGFHVEFPTLVDSRIRLSACHAPLGQINLTVTGKEEEDGKEDITYEVDTFGCNW